MINFFNFLISSSFVNVAVTLGPPVAVRSCQPSLITIKECHQQGYQYTALTDQVESNSEKQVLSELEKFRSLINQRCSKDLNFLLCSVIVPMCDLEPKTVVEPCEHLCDQIKERCGPELTALHLQWPEVINCSIITKPRGSQKPCILPPSYIRHSTRKPPQPLLKVHLTEGVLMKKAHLSGGQCRYLRHSEKYVFINRTGRCALKCSEDDLFSKESKRLAEIWMSVLAALTFVFTLFTCITGCLSEKIRYPAQPILFLTLSYNLYSISFLLRLFFSRSTVSCDFDPVSGEHILIQEGLENTHCAITFLLNFFFSTATHIWWVTLNASWVLYSVFNVSVSNLKANAGYFHMFVWLSTSMLTVSVLVLRCVEADELLGVCSVGGQSPDLFMTFSIIPKTTCLVLGTFLLCVALIFQKSRTKNSNGNPKKKLFKMTPKEFRLALFSASYVLATSILIGCELYQYINYNTWKWVNRIFRHVKEPAVAMFLLHIFASQVIGINSAICIWSLGAASSWKRFLKRFKIKFGKNLNQSELQIGATNQNRYSTHSNHHYLYSTTVVEA